MITSLVEQLKRDEGEKKKSGRHVAYQDHLGYLTLGYGRLIDERRGGGLSDAEAEYLLDNDIGACKQALQVRLPWFVSLSETRQAALINMAFQLGVNGLLQFKKTLSLIEKKEYHKASKEMMDSLWARQTPSRAMRVSRQLRTGEWV